MKSWFLMLGCVALLGLVGCENKPQQGEADTSKTKSFGPEGMKTTGMAKATDTERATPIVVLKMIGRHKGAEPKPRHVNFADITGQMYMPGGKFLALESIRLGFVVQMLDVDAEASGLSKEEAGKLREHLRGVDFFNTKQFQTAEFETTSVKLNEDGTGTIVGKLKLLGQTQELTIPVTHNAEKKLLEAKFDLDRTKFGMNFGLDTVEEVVEVQISLDGSKG
ncbi:MAG: YceI family protein [Pirellulaceae bacterium]|nr:YceI family protein [Pirellulaceae bacterium]